MAKLLKNRIVAISPKYEHLVPDLRSKLVQELNNAGLRYLHVGAGAEAAYAVLPDDQNLLKLEEVAVSCDAIVSGSGYLRLENGESSEMEGEWIEHALVHHPINYDIPVVGSYDQAYGLCGRCGGIGSHIGPPCKS